MTLFEDGVAAITGAASGIGRATASAIANDGCTKLMFGDVSIVGIEETRRLVLEKHPEAQIRLRELDISDEASVERFYGAAVEHFGRMTTPGRRSMLTHSMRLPKRRSTSSTLSIKRGYVPLSCDTPVTPLHVKHRNCT
ncbi:hypothetical protein EDB81DRAFT_810728 [Dactylonectria macrodidyma]|uniref:Uncharacterized protein n=1 Tax=Dactylonectria macrodidyma TaxID=307937 RepID=A0A9P9DRH0_9HYPO|nr:hypothetical protein EDB81DRAFT_810728 [Dactylonectria macrodidyma]